MRVWRREVLNKYQIIFINDVVILSKVLDKILALHDVFKNINQRIYDYFSTK
jgi:hypothetical protein